MVGRCFLSLLGFVFGGRELDLFFFCAVVGLSPCSVFFLFFFCLTIDCVRPISCTVHRQLAVCQYRVRVGTRVWLLMVMVMVMVMV